MSTPKTVERGRKDDGPGHDPFHIFVNRKKFEEKDGVKAKMTVAEIAALVGIPAANAVVRRGNNSNAPIVEGSEPLIIKHAEHFLVTRRTVEGGFEIPPRIFREITILKDGGQAAEYVHEGRAAVIYRGVPVAGARPGLPTETDVLVPVPGGYPSMIDLAALPTGSPLIGRVKGAANQGTVVAGGITWQLISYHPHNGGGGPPWDPTMHGFHTYFDEVLAWLDRLQ